MAQTKLDVLINVQGSGKLQAAASQFAGVEKAAKNAGGKLPAVANGIKATGRASKGAAVGVKTLGAAFNTALGPLGAALAAVAGLTAAFGKLQAQGFAIAKLKTLGVETDVLVGNLKEVSAELNGSASVADLTGAAYDVASAGFADAADNAQVLKAAALGAAGGFTDMNTAGNALTSVLNAYGLSADRAEKIMDQFVQTQNDGKVVVAEYARNIGKVASAAASLDVPLSEVNAVIAQSTVAGVQAEVAFTGVKTALARLASGEAAKALEGTGVQIDAASVAADGLVGTLRKMKEAGLDTGQMFKAFGTEAVTAILPLFNDFEKLETLVRNQEDAAGVAANAHSIAADTIGGAWKRLTSVFDNFITGQSALGDTIKTLINVVTLALEGALKYINLILTPLQNGLKFLNMLVKGAQALYQAFADAFRETEAFKALQIIAENVAGWFQDIGQSVSGVMAPAFKAILGWAGDLAKLLGGAIYQSIDWMVQGLANAYSLIPGMKNASADLLIEWGKIKTEVEAAKNGIKDAAESQDDVADSAQNAALSAEELAEAQKEVTRAIQESTAELDRYAQATQSIADLETSLASEKLKTEQLVNDALLEQANKRLDNAQNEQQRIAAARSVYRLTVQQAEIERQATQASIAAGLAKKAAQVQTLQLKAREVAIVVQLARAEGTVNAEHEKALALAQESVTVAEQQLGIQKQIAGEQLKQADLTFEAKQRAAELAFEQNKVFEATQGAATAAGQFANNMQSAASAASQAATAANAATAGPNPTSEGTAGTTRYNIGGPAASDPYFQKIVADANKQFQERDFNSSKIANKEWRAVQEDLMRKAQRFNRRVNEGQMDEARDNYRNIIRGQNGSGGGRMSAQVNVTTGPVMNMDGQNFVSQDDFMSGLQYAAEEGASLALSTLEGSGDSRRSAGLG